jgi:hypothetical protein
MRAATVVGAAVGAILALAAGSELVLRYGLGLGNPILVQADPAAGYIVKPDQDVHRFFSYAHINHQGMRSDEIAPVRDPRALRVMFVGDSVTYGTSRVDQDHLFSQIIHHALPDVIHRPVEVLNASASAWAPDNEWAYVRSRGIFGSDWVVLVLNSGDLAQPPSTLADVGDDLPAVRPATAWAELYTRFIGPRLFHLRRKNDAGISGAPMDAEAVVAANLADMDQLQGFVRDHGARLMIIYLPFRRDIPTQSAPSLATLQAWTTQHDVKLIDLTAVEAAHPSSQITLDGVHLNAAGHALVADAILKQWPG